MSVGKSLKLKDLIGSELHSFLLKDDLCPSCVQIVVCYDGVSARLDIDQSLIEKIFMKEKEIEENG